MYKLRCEKDVPATATNSKHVSIKNARYEYFGYHNSFKNPCCRMKGEYSQLKE